MFMLLDNPSSGVATIQDTVSSAICDLWAGETTSYSGTGTAWANLIASPSDGSTQAANDFTIDDLVSGGGVTFSTDHFLPDGSDDGLEMTGAITTFWDELHQNTSGKQWFYVFYGDLPLTSTVSLFDQTSISSGNKGLSCRVLTSGRLDVFQSNGSSNASYNSASGVITTGKKLTIVTFDFDTNAVKIYHNGVKTTGTLTYGASTGSATNKPRFGLTHADALDFSSGTEVYGIGYGDGFVSDADAASLKTFYESR